MPMGYGSPENKMRRCERCRHCLLPRPVELPESRQADYEAALCHEASSFAPVASNVPSKSSLQGNSTLLILFLCYIGYIGKSEEEIWWGP